MYLKTIENVHNVKTTFLNSFVKDKELNKSLTELVDAEAQFGKSLVKSLTEIQTSLNNFFYKPATWLKS
jgi:hypothetical protein